MRSTSVQSRTYDVIEEFSMGGVDVHARWEITVRGDETLYAELSIAIDESHIDSEATVHVDIDAVPHHVLDDVRERIKDDAYIIEKSLDER